MSFKKEIDSIIILGEGIRPDGSASTPTCAVGEKAVSIIKLFELKVPVIISGGSIASGVTEGMAIKKILNANNIKKLFVLDTKVFPSGTHLQPEAIQEQMKKNNLRKVILIAHPVHIARALWVFKKYFPKIKFIPMASNEVYDKKMIQVRLHNKFFFTIWNNMAWIHNYLFYKFK